MQQKPILIAEIGNSHFGNFNNAKHLIIKARDSGASLVKLQAIDSDQTGSMPQGFYRDVAFTTEQYLELIYFGKENYIDVFYTVVSNKHNDLYFKQKFFKFSGGMTKNAFPKIKSFIDFNNHAKGFTKRGLTFASIPAGCLEIVEYYDRAGWICLFVSEYLIEKVTDLSFLLNIDLMSEKIKMENPYGYSDHTCGITACEFAIKEYGCTVIEKHFTDKKYGYWNDHLFRDTVFSADGKELKQIAKMLGV